MPDVLRSLIMVSALASFICVMSTAMPLSGGPLALPAFVVVLGLEASKIGLPALVWSSFLRCKSPSVRILGVIWAACFWVCAAAACAFAGGPRQVADRVHAELLNRKAAALRSMERTMDDGDYMSASDAKRLTERRGEVAQMKAQAPRLIVEKAKEFGEPDLWRAAK